jgi:ankyrin repeat protein
MSLDLIGAVNAPNQAASLQNIPNMIARGATETKDSNNNTPLILAILKNSQPLFNILVRKNKSYTPDLNAVNSDGETPLLISIRMGNASFVKTLLANGADANKADADGITPLSKANIAGRADIMSSLIAKRVNVNTVLEDPNTALEVSQLQYAAANGNINTVNAILSGNPDIDAVDPANNTALIAAAKAGKLDVVNALIAKGADASKANDDGETALSAAENNGHTEVQEALSAVGGGGRRRGSKTRRSKSRGRKTRGRKTPARKNKKRTVRR